MNSRLEQFVRDNREEFDSEVPGGKIWEKIRQEVEPGKKKQANLIRFTPLRWSAAAIILLMAGAAWYYLGSHSGRTAPSQPAIAHQTPSTDKTSKDQPEKAPVTAPKEDPATEKNLADATPRSNNVTPGSKKEDKPSDMDASVNEEMYHYARLVEIKHNQLKTIEKDEPLLYKQFASDVYRLDSVYHNLQKQLPTNPNREQLLEAMLQNLQMQMGLLNHQLDIIKQINHSKKAAYERAYKTI